MGGGGGGGGGGPKDFMTAPQLTNILVTIPFLHYKDNYIHEKSIGVRNWALQAHS